MTSHPYCCLQTSSSWGISKGGRGEFGGRASWIHTMRYTMRNTNEAHENHEKQTTAIISKQQFLFFFGFAIGL
jgi:hypothetical protein